MGSEEPVRVFGSVVREFRQRAGITQEDLAESAGLHRTYISLLERGLRNPSLTVIGQLASALQVSMAELVAEFEKGLKRRSV
jgi:transcriptional regulator with XRE-family HTH domain